MQNALKRLLELRHELEALHETTARVLAESERLIDQMHRPTTLRTDPPPPPEPLERPRRKTTTRRRKTASSK